MNFIQCLRRLFGGKMSPEELSADLDKKARAYTQDKLDWRNSVVDLMKLADLDSSLSSRTAFAVELGYTGEPNGSAEMNIWLHKKIMEKLASWRSL